MVMINGKPQEAVGKTMLEIVEEGGFTPSHVAVERNEEIVPKAQYGEVKALDGDVIEIVQFVGGGA